MGVRPVRLTPLRGGCVCEVMRADLPGGRRAAVKSGGPGAALDTEGWMLDRLRAAGWPAPEVISAGPDLLILSYAESDGRMTAGAEEHAADTVAPLHSAPQPAFGFERPTVIAGLPQANPQSAAWIPFFAEHRLCAMAAEAQRAGKITPALRARIERFAGRLDKYLIEPPHPSLIHGDLWGGNMLWRGGALAAVIDPACYWADAEIELAFTTLFSTFGRRFFDRYREHREIAPGFFEARRDIYNLYPLLVHARLFGGHYPGAAERTLKRFGV